MIGPNKNFLRYEVKMDAKSNKVAIFDFKGNQVSQQFDDIFLIKKTFEYYVAKEKDKKAVFHISGKQVTPWMDNIIIGEDERASDYFIAKKEKKYAIFHVFGKQVSDWFDDIVFDLDGTIEYYFAKLNNKWAFFHVSNGQMSDWYEEVIFPPTFDLKKIRQLETKKYCIFGKDGKEAIFHVSGKQVSDWHDKIIFEDILFDRTDNYYCAVDREKHEQRKKYALFRINQDLSVERISGWFDQIFAKDLLSNKSPYYVVKQNNKKAVFHISGKQISEWFDDIVNTDEVSRGYFLVKRLNGLFEKPEYALYCIDDKNNEFKKVIDWSLKIKCDNFLKKQTDYFLVKKNNKTAIFDSEGRRISLWQNFDILDDVGALVDKKFNFYVAVKKDATGKRQQMAIFHVTGRRLTPWHQLIVRCGFLEGKSEYYLVEEDGKRAIFHISGKQISRWFRGKILKEGILNGESEFYILKTYSAFEKDQQYFIYHVSGELVVKGEGYVDASIVTDKEGLEKLQELRRINKFLNKIEGNINQTFKTKKTGFRFC